MISTQPNYGAFAPGTLFSGGNAWVPGGAAGYQRVDARQYNPASYAPGWEGGGGSNQSSMSNYYSQMMAPQQPSSGARLAAPGGQGYSFEEARRIQQQRSQPNSPQQMTQQMQNYQQYQTGLGNRNPSGTNSSYQAPQGYKPPNAYQQNTVTPSPYGVGGLPSMPGLGNPSIPGGPNWNNGTQTGSQFNQPGAVVSTPGGSNWDVSHGSMPHTPRQGTSPQQQFTTMPTNPTPGTPSAPQNPYDSAPRPGQSFFQPGGVDQYKQSLMDWQSQQPRQVGPNLGNPSTPWGPGRDNNGNPLPGLFPGDTRQPGMVYGGPAVLMPGQDPRGTPAPGATTSQQYTTDFSGVTRSMGRTQPGGTDASGAPTRQGLEGMPNYTGPMAGGQYAVTQNGYGTQVFANEQAANQWQQANPLQPRPTTAPAPTGPQIYPGVTIQPPAPPFQGGQPGTNQPRVIQAPLTQDNYNGQFNAGFQNNNGVLSPIPGFQNPATSPNAPLATAPNTPVYGNTGPTTGGGGQPGMGGPGTPGSGGGGYGGGYSGSFGPPPPAPNVTVPQVNLQAPQQVNLGSSLPSMYDEQGRAIMPGGTTPNRMSVPLITEQQQNQQLNQVMGQNATSYETQMADMYEGLAARGLSPDSASASGVGNRLSLNRALADTQAATSLPLQVQQANANYLLQGAGVDAQNRGLGIQSYEALVRAMQGQDSLGIQAAAQNNNALDNYQGRGLQYAGLGLQGQQLGLQGYQAQNDAYNQFYNQMNQRDNLGLQNRSLDLNAYQSYQNAQNQYYNLLNQSRNTDVNAYQAQNQNNLGLAQLLQQYV